MVKMENNTQQLDQDAVNLAKAIRQTESGGNFNARGKSGEFGAYQFTEPTWNAYASKYGINVPLEKATREQQNEVAYKQIKEWKDKGYNVGQIASMWNAGESRPDAYKENHTGTNKYGVHYDTPKYAESVARAYHTIKGGGQVNADPNNPSSTASNLTKDVIVGSDQNQQPNQQGETGLKGFSTGVAKSELGLVKDLGNVGANIAQGIGGLVLGKDKAQQIFPNVYKDSKVLSKENLKGKSKSEKIGKTITDVATAVAPIGAEEKSAGLLSKLMKSGDAMKSPAIETTLKAFRMNRPEFESLSVGEKYNFLKEAMKSAPEDIKRVLQQAIDKIEPAAIKAQGGKVPFSMLHPNWAKAGGAIGNLIKGAVKNALPIGGAYELGQYLSKK